MIIGVSIVDKHKPKGKGHVGTYMFEIDYPAGDSHFDFMTLWAQTTEGEDELRPYLGRLLQRDDMPRPVRGNGEPV